MSIERRSSFGFASPNQGITPSNDAARLLEQIQTDIPRMDHFGRSVCSNLAFPARLHSRRRFGIVDILVARKTAKHGLPQHSDESMAAVLAGPCVREPVAGHRGQAERVVEFSVGEQAGVGGDTDPRNWSISRRSKSSLSASAFDSPAEFAITASFDPE